MSFQGEFFEKPAVSVQIDDHAENEITTIIESPKPAISNSLTARKTMKDLSIPKLYYSISEVSRLTGLEPYVLRYWETEFEELKPQKNRAGNRIYSNRDIKFILRIKELLREKRYTIEGAKVILRTDRIADLKSDETPSSNDPAQIPISSEPKSIPQATLTIDEIRAMKESLMELRAVMMKG
jgi:DNA-binding transcriptional MerR regulator